MGNHELLKLTAHQVKERNYDKAILSVGACEAHGQHLAEGTDTLLPYIMSNQIADQVEGLLVLPPITVGYSAHYDAFPFTLTLSYDTITSVVYDILESTIRNGILKIFIMNGHDGNISAIEVASRKIKEKYPDVRIAALPAWWITVGELLPVGTFEVWDGLGHAGEGETSLCYHLIPQWCQPEFAEGVVPDHLPGNVEIKWDFSELTHTAATGDPTKGTAEKGKLMTEALTKCVIDAIRELDERNWDYSSTEAATKLS